MRGTLRPPAAGTARCQNKRRSKQAAAAPRTQLLGAPRRAALVVSHL
jgi:hypothetical protein